MTGNNQAIPGSRQVRVKDALDDLVNHIALELEMSECLKIRIIELNQMMRDGKCADVVRIPHSEPAVDVVVATELEEPLSPLPLAKEGENGALDLSEEERDFVRRLMRISGRLTKNQREALDAVRSSNSALFELLALEVAAESGERQLVDPSLPEGRAGTSGLKGEGLPAWNRKLTLDPNKNDAIFIALVTYRDPQCPQSLVEAFSRAEKPDRIFVGVVQQNRESDIDCFDKYCELAGAACRHRQVRVIRMADTDSRGVMRARWLASTLWSGERWFLQVDAHSGFNYAWDKMVIESILRTKDDRAVLSHHPPDMAQWPHSASGDNLINICKYHWDDTGMPRFSSIMVNKKANGIKAPFPNTFIGAGMVFGRAQWIVDCPFDHYLQFLFSGEELLLSICLFTKGWNVYNPDSLPVWHWYKRNIAGRENPSVNHLLQKSLKRLKYLMGLIDAREVPRDFLVDVHPYFMGKIRTREEFWTYSGINWEDAKTKKKDVSQPFCAVYVNSVTAHVHYKYHYRPPMGLPTLESYNFDTVPMVPLKFKSTAAPLAEYKKDMAKEVASIPIPKIKRL